MKTDIHPDYKETTIGCACGNVLEVVRLWKRVGGWIHKKGYPR
jgi:ribosomal protein L31